MQPEIMVINHKEYCSPAFVIFIEEVANRPSVHDLMLQSSCTENHKKQSAQNIDLALLPIPIKSLIKLLTH